MGFKIEGLHAFLAVDEDGDEGVTGRRMPDGTWLPLIAADQTRLELLRPYAQELANNSGQTIKLVRFTARIDLETLTQIDPRIIGHEDAYIIKPRLMADGREVSVRLMFGDEADICVGLPGSAAIDDVWSYQSATEAIVALAAWNPFLEREPQNWCKHSPSGRRRPDGDALKEVICD